MGQNSGLLSSLTDWNTTLAGYADSISSGVVMPIALTVLALFMVLELYNFTQTIAINGGSTAFTIQQVALVMLKITLCRWAVLHSTEILNAMFEVAATVTNPTEKSVLAEFLPAHSTQLRIVAPGANLY